MEFYAERIVKSALNIKAIKLNPEKPFIWASGYQMPIYNDNRMLLFYPSCRELISEGFINLIKEKQIKNIDVIAGTSTAGISPATTLADKLELPLIYVRDKPKDHGLKNQIEGIDANSDLLYKKVILIEDLISTGGSSIKAVEAIRNAKGECFKCLSIFNYGFKQAENEFKFINCKLYSVLDYDTLLKIAKEIGYINSNQEKMLAEWREDPFNWGEKHGFPKIEKAK